MTVFLGVLLRPDLRMRAQLLGGRGPGGLGEIDGIVGDSCSVIVMGRSG